MLGGRAAALGNEQKVTKGKSTCFEKSGSLIWNARFAMEAAGELILTSCLHCCCWKWNLLAPLLEAAARFVTGSGARTLRSSAWSDLASSRTTRSSNCCHGEVATAGEDQQADHVAIDGAEEERRRDEVMKLERIGSYQRPAVRDQDGCAGAALARPGRPRGPTPGVHLAYAGDLKEPPWIVVLAGRSRLHVPRPQPPLAMNALESLWPLRAPPSPWPASFEVHGTGRALRRWPRGRNSEES
jgi:hypothetical protein